MKTKYIILGCSMFFCHFLSFAQTTNQAYTSSIKMGGYNLFKDDIGSVVGLDFNYFKKGGVYSFSYESFNELHMTGSIKPEHFNTVTGLIGFYTQNKNIVFTHQVGLSYLFGTITSVTTNQNEFGVVTKTESQNEVYEFGIGFNFGFKYIVNSNVNLGVNFQSSINREQIVAMPMITLGYGNLGNLLLK